MLLFFVIPGILIPSEFAQAARGHRQKRGSAHTAEHLPKAKRPCKNKNQKDNPELRMKRYISSHGGVIYNPPGDGFCFWYSLIFLLNNSGINLPSGPILHPIPVEHGYQQLLQEALLLQEQALNFLTHVQDSIIAFNTQGLVLPPQVQAFLNAVSSHNILPAELVDDLDNFLPILQLEIQEQRIDPQAPLPMNLPQATNFMVLASAFANNVIIPIIDFADVPNASDLGLDDTQHDIQGQIQLYTPSGPAWGAAISLGGGNMAMALDSGHFVIVPYGGPEHLVLNHLGHSNIVAVRRAPLPAAYSFLSSSFLSPILFIAKICMFWNWQTWKH